MGWMNNPEERKRARDAVTPLDESKRPVSNITIEALEQRQFEASLNDAAIAAVVAADAAEMEETFDDAKSNSPKTIKTIALPIPSPFDKKNELKDSIPGMDEVPDDLQNLCLFYTADPCEEKKEVSVHLPKASFFKKDLAQRLHDAANDLLHGYGDKAEALIAENKWVAGWETVGSDRFGRRVPGRTLIQMAAMNCDVNTRERKAEEKEDYGMLERLKKAAGLTEEEVAKQLFPVLFSKEAKQENEARKKRVLTVFIEFGEALLKRKYELPIRWETTDEFETAAKKCQPEIENLRRDLLKAISNEVINSGYILDLEVYLQLEKWYKRPENLERKWGGVITDIFWRSCAGSLQYVSAAPDAHVYHAGIGRVNDGILPKRTLKNSDGSSHFGGDSKLGEDFYLGHYGSIVGCRPLFGYDAFGIRDAIEKLMSDKDNSILQNYAKPSALCDAQEMLSNVARRV